MDVIVLERAVMALMEAYQNGHDFAQTQRALTHAALHTTAD